MADVDRSVDKVLAALQERAKELTCLYEVENALNQPDLILEEAFQTVVEAIPPGWQYPDVCRASIEYGGRVYKSEHFATSEWHQQAQIVVQERRVGTVDVWYVEERPREAIGPFLEEEQRLIRTIADRLAHAILYSQLKEMRQQWESTSEPAGGDLNDRWRGPINLLLHSDRKLYLRIARKMLNHLCWNGVDGAGELLQEAFGRRDSNESANEMNVPDQSWEMNEAVLLSGVPFEHAGRHLADDEILALVQGWITEDTASFLPKVLLSPKASLAELSEALQRFHHLFGDGAELPEPTLNSLRVWLIRRFLTEQLDFVGVAKSYIGVADFITLIDHVILSSASYGKLGGKTSGLFLAEKVLRTKAAEGSPELGSFKVPRSWYLPSECMMRFIEHNDLEEVLQQKYKPEEQVRREYPNVVQLFKGSRMPADVAKELAMVLDEVGETPIIVRSSSLLEDRLGSAFSGKYKSLFLANQGSREERLAALLAAITEVYASVFGPDPIVYRCERGLLDFHEEMGILLQEVVGCRVGRFFLPAAAGVAFSHNELRWSARIKREDGLLRLVPGLGTRAVDRVGDDYPMLVVPGQPGLRVNPSIEETVRYSPAKIDVIDVEQNTLATMRVRDLLRHCAARYPAFEQVFSLVKDNRLQRASRLLFKPDRDEVVADFRGLVDDSDFVERIDAMVKALEHSLGTPVDIEFAYDGEDLYLLQCRPQSYSDDEAPAPIPKDVPEDDIVFAANRYVCNGWVPDLTHLVYVDPLQYQQLCERDHLQAVGRVVAQLNKLLPKRQFALIGPGRWGSRGDIRLGIAVTYADINNTALLVEVARSAAGYLPDLSFGTHFFQDLVESAIRYLPLYPDDDSLLNERFLLGAENLLAQMLPELAWLEQVVRVVDIQSSSGGRVLRVLMNSELDQAVALLVDPQSSGSAQHPDSVARRSHRRQDYWSWRVKKAERLAARLDPQRFGVAALYLIGSTKNATAGPASDIDLLIHVRGSEAQRRDLLSWLEGWSLSLAEENFLRTGYRTKGLLDVHLITDTDLQQRSSFACKIGAVTDPARELPLGGG